MKLKQAFEGIFSITFLFIPNCNNSAGNQNVYLDENERIKVNRGRNILDYEIINYTDSDSVGIFSNGQSVSLSYKIFNIQSYKRQ